MVGPATKTMSARTTASTMLMLESHWMPRLMPETAEATKQEVRMATITTRTGVPISRPSRWRSGRCRSAGHHFAEAAVPKSVAKMAEMLMNFPSGPSTILMPKSEVKAAEISCLRPRR